MVLELVPPRQDGLAAILRNQFPVGRHKTSQIASIAQFLKYMWGHEKIGKNKRFLNVQ